MRKFGFILVVLFLSPALAGAQGTKISGTVECGPPNPQHVLPVEGRSNHTYGVSQTKCTWTKPWEMGGVASKEGVGTGMEENHGDWSHSSGTYVDSMANGDKVYYKYEFKTKMKEGMLPEISGHKWEILGGTGKFKGAKGKGTCNVTPQEAGSANYECQGDYQLAQ